MSTDLTIVKRKLTFNTRGTGLLKDEINANAILTYDPRWQDAAQIYFDSFDGQIRCQTPPWDSDDAPAEPTDVWSDSDDQRLRNWLIRNWSLDLPVDKVRATVDLVAKRNARHPLQMWLDSLQWDGEKRLDQWLVTYAGAEDTDYVRVAGRKWILSAVARAYEPGCEAHLVLILEGPQGVGKSTLLRSLVPVRSWFSDTPIDIKSKDSYIALRGKWIIEWGELASLRRVDLDRVKAFITSSVDDYRNPYGRRNVQVPRTVVFAGSVNDDEYLADSTGNRRFVPIRTGTLDADGLVEARDQIWAEAVHTYKQWVERGRDSAECPWWPSTEEQQELFAPAQADREVIDARAPAIGKWLDTREAQRLLIEQCHLTTGDIARGALGVDLADIDRSLQTSIGVVMTREMKWTKRRVSISGARAWVFAPPGERG